VWRIVQASQRRILVAREVSYCTVSGSVADCNVTVEVFVLGCMDLEVVGKSRLWVDMALSAVAVSVLVDLQRNILGSGCRNHCDVCFS
jgi:hypothetical protein